MHTPVRGRKIFLLAFAWLPYTAGLFPGDWSGTFRLLRRRAVTKDRLNLRETGFTIVELLVVVAIIAVLIAMLIPSLQRTRDSLYNASCLSRMKQIYVFTVAYQSDYKNYYVSGNFYNGPGGWNAYFGYQLLPYIPERYAHITNANGGLTSTPNNNFLLCPATKKPPICNTVSEARPYAYANNGLVAGYYGTMHFGGGNAASWNTEQRVEWYYPKNVLRRPNIIPYFMEIYSNNPYLCYTTVGTVMYNHAEGKGTNVVFNDGSIKSYNVDLQAEHDAGRFDFW